MCLFKVLMSSEQTETLTPATKPKEAAVCGLLGGHGAPTLQCIAIYVQRSRTNSPEM